MSYSNLSEKISYHAKVLFHFIDIDTYDELFCLPEKLVHWYTALFYMFWFLYYTLISGKVNETNNKNAVYCKFINSTHYNNMLLITWT